MENEDMLIQKEKQIVKKFESLFKLHGYNSYDSFDSKVWFIRNNSQIQTYITNHSQNQTPDMTYNISNSSSIKSKHKPKLLEVFSKCNHSRINKDDFTQMTISVREFIDTISNTLADIYSSIKISEENIHKNDSLAKVAKITEIIHLLNNKMTGKSKIYFESKLIAVISSISNFQCSPYKAMLLINTDHNNNELIQDLFQEESLTLNALINVNANQDNETILLNNSKKAKKSTYSFPQYSFGILENDNNNLLVDKRINGTSFSNFKLTLQGKSGRIESNVEYFLHLILTSIDELCDLTKEIWNKNCVLKMNDGKEDNNKKKDNEKTVSVDFIIELDDLTRIGILKRVKELISFPIDTKTQCLMDIDEILTDFFPEIKESVMNILNREEESRSNCCAGCIII